MKHSNGSIAQCRSHLQSGPWHSRACVPYKERLRESQVHADRVCVCARVCAFDWVLAWTEQLKNKGGRQVRGKESILVFTEALRSAVGSKQRAAAFRSRSQLPSLTGHRSENTQGNF